MGAGFIQVTAQREQRVTWCNKDQTPELWMCTVVWCSLAVRLTGGMPDRLHPLCFCDLQFCQTFFLQVDRS